MSLDQRLRDHLRSMAELADTDPESPVLQQVLDRGRRGRSTRGATIAACLVVVVSASVILPTALGIGGSDRIRPADQRASLEPPLGREPLFVASGYGLGFSADGSVLFVRAGTSGAAISDARSGRVLKWVEGRRGNAVVAFSPDGGTFVTVRGGQEISELDTYVNDTGTEKILLHLRKACCFATFSPDGSLIALPNAGRTRVIAVENGDPVDEFEDFGNIAFSPDGGDIVVMELTKHGVIGHVYEIGGASGPTLTLSGDLGDDPFASVPQWSPDGSLIAATSGSGDLILWDAETGRHVFTISSPTGRFTSLAFGSDPAQLATGSSDGMAIVWELTIGGAQIVLALDARIGTGKWLTVALSPDGTRLMTSSPSNETKVWDVSR